MSSIIGEAELESMRDAAVHCMLDKCQLGTPTLEGSGDPTAVTWTWSNDVECGFDASASREVADGSQASMTDAVLRLPLNVTVRSDMRVRMTYRSGLPVLPEYYAVLGEPRRGLSAQQVYLRRLTGESVL